jgi:hypothetical protein
MKRYEIIQRFIDKYSYKSYLEIGVLGGEAFNAIKINSKKSVDPAGNATFVMTSDLYFSKFIDHRYDIIFIDGLHLRHQVMRDILNSLNCLNYNGTIVMHDCLPTNESEQVPYELGGVPWTGDVWKAFAELRCIRSDLEMFVVNTDYGCGVIRKGQQELFIPPKHTDIYTWDFFIKNRDRLMNIISVKDFKNAK